MKVIPLSVSPVLLLLAMILHLPEVTSAQESDPCYNYTVLNDTWRDTTYVINSNYNCDSYEWLGSSLQWQGWYLFVLYNVSVRMPEVCLPENHCGTHVPLWLNGSHPRPEDGIVTRQVCASYTNNCCYPLVKPIPPIQVKACPGNYTVYKLVDPRWCWLAYCADASNKGVLPATTLAPIAANHVVGLRLEVSSTQTLNDTEIEETILKPFGDRLREQGVYVNGIRLRRVYETKP